ncbi:MAG: hypothetical protein D5S03_08110 [Desulfonatronospira sp. MSAO_Bac3]|nr:MAG: hypothetical protein D5S03_08110 [Desulfonatronospira sp. MSAO_Bac3]
MAACRVVDVWKFKALGFGVAYSGVLLQNLCAPEEEYFFGLKFWLQLIGLLVTKLVRSMIEGWIVKNVTLTIQAATFSQEPFGGWR